MLFRSRSLDMEPYQDCVFWLDVREVTAGGGTVSMNYETSPIQDDAYFKGMVTAVTMTASSTPTRTIALLGSATIAVSRWLRWRISVAGASDAWDATFRIWVSTNSPGA